MDYSITDYAFGDRPPVTMPSPGIFHFLGEEGMRKMVSDHYDLIARSPIKDLFPPVGAPLEKAKQRSADFFIQICGGPSYYRENRGEPRLQKRHAKGAITKDARIVWLRCYEEVLSKLSIPEEDLLSFWTYLNTFSIWMVNTADQQFPMPDFIRFKKKA